jgi:DNA-binding beta-propeller fold protein YncE
VRAVALAAAATLLAALTGCAEAPQARPAAADTPAVAGAVWVANEGGSSLSVLDAATAELTATVTSLPAPHNVQAARDGSTVWAVSGADLLVALAADGSLLGTTTTDPHPAHVVPTAEDGPLVTSSDGWSLSAYSRDLVPQYRLELPGAPHGVRTSADGGIAVVAGAGGDSLDVVDLLRRTVIGSVDVGGAPVQTADSDDGAWAWASVSTTSEVVKVSLTERRVVARRTLAAAPAQILLTAAGDLLTADQGTSDRPGSTVTVLDPGDLSVRAQIRVGSGPHGLAADPTGRFGWVTNTYDSTVTALDLLGRRAVRTVAVGGAPNGITFVPGPAAARDVDLQLTAAPADEQGHQHDEETAHAP